MTNKDDNLGSNGLQDLGVPHSRKPPLRYPLTMLMDVNQQKIYNWEVVPAIILEISSNQHVASTKNYGTLTSQLYNFLMFWVYILFSALPNTESNHETCDQARRLLGFDPRKGMAMESEDMYYRLSHDLQLDKTREKSTQVLIKC